jgi:hypothetical protein
VIVCLSAACAVKLRQSTMMLLSEEKVVRVIHIKQKCLKNRALSKNSGF